jgi:hypothetical protein
MHFAPIALALLSTFTLVTATPIDTTTLQSSSDAVVFHSKAIVVNATELVLISLHRTLAKPAPRALMKNAPIRQLTSI